jgi:hypothetical protein
MSGNIPLDVDCLVASCTIATKLGQLEHRMSSKKISFYRLSGSNSSWTLQNERSGNWILPQLPRSYFASVTFLEHVKLVNDFISFTDIMGVKIRL